MAQQVEGLSRLLKDLQSFGKEGEQYAIAVTNATAETIVNQAKVSAPIGKTGQLRLETGFNKAEGEKNTAIIYSNAPYSPYINWGTGGKVSVTPLFEKYALEFKKPNVRNISIQATGFLTVPYEYNAKQYPKDLEKALNKLTKQYNNKK